MKLGICTSFQSAEYLHSLGYSYLELNAAEFTLKKSSEFNLLLQQVKQSPLPAYACNVLLPHGYSVIGNDLEPFKLQEYLIKAFVRARKLGIQVVVFGSGGARRIPDGFSKEKAKEQLLDFLYMLDSLAQQYRITVVLEPLRAAETNFITTAREGLELVKQCNSTSIRLLLDYYHMSCEQDDISIILEAGKEYLYHVHIANPTNRTYPKSTDAADYAMFFKYLQQIGYTGGVSIEAGTSDIGKDATESMELFSALLKEYNTDNSR